MGRGEGGEAKGKGEGGERKGEEGAEGGGEGGVGSPRQTDKNWSHGTLALLPENSCLVICLRLNF